MRHINKKQKCIAIGIQTISVSVTIPVAISSVLILMVFVYLELAGVVGLASMFHICMSMGEWGVAGLSDDL